MNEGVRPFLQPVGAAELPGLGRTILLAARVLAIAIAIAGPVVYGLHAALSDWPLDRVLYTALVAEPLLWTALGLTYTEFGKRHPEWMLYLTASIASAYVELGGLQSPTGQNPYLLLGALAPVALAAFAPWRPVLSLVLGATDAAIYIAASWVLPEGSGMPAGVALAVSGVYALLGAAAAQTQRLIRADLQRARHAAAVARRGGQPAAPPKVEALSATSHEPPPAKATGAVAVPALATAAPAASAPAAPAPAAPAAPTLHGRVLLAENGTEERVLIERMLQRAGLHVELAENGREAHAKAMSATLSGTPFDVVFLDVEMPEMSGNEAASALRADGYDGPIVALIAQGRTIDREASLAAGHDDFATKPIDRAALLALLARFLEKPYQPKS